MLQTQSIELHGTVVKLDVDLQHVFGFASVSSIDGKAVIDKQGDTISEVSLEAMAYHFVLNSRIGSEMHVKKGIGRLIESVVFTKEKQKFLGIDLGKVAWWVGFKVDDSEVWQKVKTGAYKDFSIGGKGKRKEISNANV